MDGDQPINLEATDKEELLEIINHWKNKCIESDGKYDSLEKKYEEISQCPPCTTCSTQTSATKSLPAESNAAERSEIAEMRRQLKEALEQFTILHDIVNSSSESRNKERIEVLDQYGRKNCLIFLKLRAPDGTYGIAYIKWIVNMLNDLFPDLEEPVKIDHIDDAHPLPSQEDGTSVAIVKFACRWVKNEIYKKRASLKGKDISISEQLTPYTRAILDDVKEMVGEGTKVYTNNCVINFKFNKKKYHIRNYKDLRTVANLIGKRVPPPGLRLPSNKSHSAPYTSTIPQQYGGTAPPL